MNRHLGNRSVSIPMWLRLILITSGMTALLLVASERASLAQPYAVGGRLPGNGRVTGFYSSPTYFSITVAGGALTGHETATIYYGAWISPELGYWYGQLDFEGIEGQRTISAYMTVFGAITHNMKREPGDPQNGQSIITLFGGFPLGPTHFGAFASHGPDTDRYESRLALTFIPHPAYTRIGSNTFTLTGFHQGTGAALAPEPATPALLGVGLGMAGLVARRRFR